MLGRENRLRDDVEEKFKQFCVQAIESEVEVQSRHTLGIALGRLGDPRVLVDLRDTAAYVPIPAGEYAWQEERQTIDEPFLLSRYLVTNSQYALFVNDDGYRQREYWSKHGWGWKENRGVTETALLA